MARLYITSEQLKETFLAIRRDGNVSFPIAGELNKKTDASASVFLFNYQRLNWMYSRFRIQHTEVEYGWYPAGFQPRQTFCNSQPAEPQKDQHKQIRL